VNLGHCLGDHHSASGRAARDAIDIAYGRLQLSPRAPSEHDAVTAAEAILGATPRPVYCYVGCLHPGLGTVGFIFDEACCSDGLQGVSRCDSGGLAGGIGPFVFVPEEDRESSLVELSFRDGHLEEWSTAFDSELSASYPMPVDYAQGVVPNTHGWSDARARCLDLISRETAAGRTDMPVADRRLWTWEARFAQGPAHHQLRVLVLSSSQASSLTWDELRELGDLPAHVKVITGRSSAAGTDEVFSSLEVTTALVET